MQRKAPRFAWLPNFFFHVTAYALLRKNGVDLGKRAFLWLGPGPIATRALTEQKNNRDVRLCTVMESARFDPADMQGYIEHYVDLRPDHRPCCKAV
jgi:hypothetical protein